VLQIENLLLRARTRVRLSSKCVREQLIVLNNIPPLIRRLIPPPTMLNIILQQNQQKLRRNRKPHPHPIARVRLLQERRTRIVLPIAANTKCHPLATLRLEFDGTLFDLITIIVGK
jgi:hypothetical protein